ncbi:hypothetical protein [Pelagimonas varians]|uniref:Uncharacterized protein n=1 Tax=Pelagimonas varians TaxID=696760 RepID=A0A238JRH7_9RHOB|nr:hypothetical protein [Pelagimonas varians]PYG34805.1 hypothetical protein C8N36_101462 [Pelagimonas varians]SMX32346.1 hypothetical protein PEV8663_00005 [Pelagimonas varians]
MKNLAILIAITGFLAACEGPMGQSSAENVSDSANSTVTSVDPADAGDMIDENQDREQVQDHVQGL